MRSASASAAGPIWCPWYSQISKASAPKALSWSRSPILGRLRITLLCSQTIRPIGWPFRSMSMGYQEYQVDSVFDDRIYTPHFSRSHNFRSPSFISWMAFNFITSPVSQTEE